MNRNFRWLALAVTFSLLSQLPLAAKSKDSAKTKDGAAAKESSSVRRHSRSADDNIGNAAIDKETMSLINRGSWKAVSDRLGKQLVDSKAHGKSKSSGREQLIDSYRQGWQAFAWMYQSQNDDLKKLVEGMSKECFDASLAKDDDDKRMLGNALVIKCFDQIGQGKLDDAEATLKSAPEICSQDALYNFALAAVSGKRGQAARAVQYARVATTIDPRFAWGYRTIGFLAQKLLKDNATAEDALTSALKVEPQLDEARDMLVEIKLARNDFDGATDVALEGIRVEPKYAPSHFRLAQILTQQWRLREALKELDLAIAQDPKSAKYFRNRASVKRCQKDLEGAIADQTVACDLSKDKGFELTELANLNLAAGNKNKAIENFKQALVLNPENEVAREKLFKLLVEEKRYTDLVDAYQEQIKRYPKSSELHMGYANVLLISGNKDKAIEEYKEAANLNQTDPAPHRALAAYYVQQQQFNMAAKEFTRALNILPTSVKDLVALGFCYAETDDFMQAEAAFVTALALQQLSPNGGMPDDPSRLDVMRSLAYLLYDEGRYSDASGQFDNIIAIYKDKGANKEDSFFLARCKLMRDLGATPAKNLLAAFKELPADRQETLRYGMVESLLDAGQPELARQALDEVAEAKRKTLAYGLYDGATWRLAGDNKKALEVVAPAVALAEASKNEDRAMASRVLCEKGRIQMNLGDTDGAITSVKAALTAYDKCYPANLLLAELLLKKGDATAALDASRRALDVNPYYAQAYVTTGEALLASGKSKEAIESFKKAVELYPCWLDAHRALLNSYRKLSMENDAQREAATIAQMESKIKSAAPAGK
ncbi:MAG: tetratricopeptide repeat protein [Cyanobacteria bacterium SZAS TMP-1]|nr:tetratricopeptide repeat protein [Cyanobacteria bacterium SZAS TMP-1]